MKFGAICFASLAMGFSMPTMAQISTDRINAICGPAIDTKSTTSVSVSLNLLSKVLDALGFKIQHQYEAKSRLQSQDDRVGALESMGMICRVIESDSSMTTERKVQILTGWGANIMLYQDSRSELELIPRRAIPAAFSSLNQAPVRDNLIWRVADISSILNSPPPPPPHNALILKIFPKADLGTDKILQLRQILPQFDIRQGRSGLSGSEYPAEVLFTNRKRTSEQTIIETLRGLAKLGIHIKSVQQNYKPDDMQVGNIIPHKGHPAFESIKSLDIDNLATLKGDEFWREAFNGQAWCDNPKKIEETRPCHISKDGRPV